MSNTIQEQQVIFYFAINETPADIGDIDETEHETLFKKLDAIQGAAWSTLHETLSTLPEWQVIDEVDGLSFCPYELCANDPESPGINGMTGFWVSIAKDGEFDKSVIPAFKQAAVEAYQNAANAHQGTARYLTAELYTVRQVTDFQRITV